MTVDDLKARLVMDGRRLSRREFIERCAAAGIVLPGAALLLDACGSTSSSTGLSTGGQPASNQDLVIGINQDEYVTTGPNGALGIYPHNVGAYEPLVHLNTDYSVSPLLATSWDVLAPDHVVFHLRSGVSWHDGTALTAADVKYTFDRIIQGQSGPTGLDSGATVTAVDDKTVDFKLSAANLRFVESIVHPYTAIVKKGTEPGPNVPGTGPFKLVEYTRQSEIKAVRNDSYWGTKAKPSSIVFKFVPDANSRALALEAGQYDLVTQLSRPVAKSLGQSGAFQVVEAPPGFYTAFYVNIHGKAPYDLGADPAIRLALQTGIDRKGMLASVFGGYGQLSQVLLPPQMMGAAGSAVQGFSYDPAKAKSALDAAGWAVGSSGTRSKNGRDLKLVMVNGFPDAAGNAGVPEFIQANLRDIGIDLSITTAFDSDSYSAIMGKLAGDLWLETGGQNDANPAFNAVGLFHSTLSYPGYGTMFAPGATYDNYVNQALADTSEEAAKADTAKAIHEVVDVAMVFVECAALGRLFGLRSNLRGFVAHPSEVSQSWAELYRVT